MSMELNPEEALARLCNAECLLQVTLRAMDGTDLDAAGWQVSESLHGILRLLDGCYVALAEEVGKDACLEQPA